LNNRNVVVHCENGHGLERASTRATGIRWHLQNEVPAQGRLVRPACNQLEIAMKLNVLRLLLLLAGPLLLATPALAQTPAAPVLDAARCEALAGGRLQTLADAPAWYCPQPHSARPFAALRVTSIRTTISACICR
jgi:hypothetical protein